MLFYLHIKINLTCLLANYTGRSDTRIGSDKYQFCKYQHLRHRFDLISEFESPDQAKRETDAQLIWSSVWSKFVWDWSGGCPDQNDDDDDDGDDDDDDDDDDYNITLTESCESWNICIGSITIHNTEFDDNITSAFKAV